MKNLHTNQISAHCFILIVLMTSASAITARTQAANWHVLFDGKTLNGWETSDFDGGGPCSIVDGAIRIERGKTSSGIRWAGNLPAINYELELEAMRISGNDFFCGLTFPVADTFCTLILGGWGGYLVGLSSIDGLDASENFTSCTRSFRNNRWYHVRLRITPDAIQAWINDDLYIDADIRYSRVSIRWEMKPSRPLGIATWKTTAAVRNIRLRRLQ